MRGIGRLLRSGFRSLRMVYVRATLGLTLVLAIFALTVTSLDYVHNVSSIRAELLKRGEELSQSVAVAVSGLVAVRKMDSIEAVLDDVATKQDVQHIWILDKEGNAYRSAPSASSPADFRQETISVMASRTASRLYSDNSFVQLQPVLYQNRVIGAVAIRLSLERVEQAKYDSIWLGTKTALWILLLFTPLGAFFMYRIARGITQVTEAANEAAAGFLSTDFPVNSSGEVGELQSAFRTMITELRSNMRQIETMASQDAVTKLPNRLSFLVLARKAVELTPRSKGACLILEVTRYSKVVEEHGYIIGDKLMVAVASRLSRKVEELTEHTNLPPASLASFSAHKFSILLPGMTDTEELTRMSDELIGLVSKPFHIENLPLVLGGAVGVSLYPEHGNTAEEIVRTANNALSASKSKQDTQVHIFTAKDKEDELEKERLEEDLWMALDSGEMTVAYQPKIDLETGKVTGAEALLRWHHPELGMVPPGRFIPIAAACGMITPIGEYVLRRAVKDCQALRDKGHDVSVSVNIDPIQFRIPDFATWVCDVVKDTGFPPDGVELEISEAMIADDPEQSRLHLAQIKEAGIRLALDNFGRDASRLQDIAKLPFDSLKVDRSFVSEITLSETHRTVTQLVLGMAKQLKIHAVAEGVETELQRDLVKVWGAKSAQGYLWSPPVDFDHYSELVEEKNNPSANVVRRPAVMRA
ncbi:putative bifunctional diguanylate cyclase/phosphodiesterase [Roseibium sp.]|uniref:putative bifunctional diguanylate cyclase/phosphodiesterase n=1 Tax=Roseibium sp. TaxID=1936156 RepID=UPI003A96F93E